MSYRDLRNLSEILRSIGYPRPVSIENFRTPNFPLVADISRWLVSQYEPKSELPSKCSTEHERINLVRSLAEFMATKVHVKLNTKRLYEADGYAVKELMKIASQLHGAMREAEEEMQNDITQRPIVSAKDTPKFDITSKLDELKGLRELSTEITERGVALYDLLTKELRLREHRQQAMARSFEQESILKLIKGSISCGNQEVTKLDNMIDAVQNNLNNLDSKIEKKHLELDRSKKRLVTMRKIRPAFMDEYESLQEELKAAYSDYVKRFRTLSYLQNQIEDMNRIDSERKAEERLNKAEWANEKEDFLAYTKAENILYSGSEDSSGEDEHRNQFNHAAREYVSSRASKMSPKGARNPLVSHGKDSSRKLGKRQLYGSMLGEDSEDSESEVILVDGDNTDFGSDEDDETPAEVLHVDADRLNRSLLNSNESVPAKINGVPPGPFTSAAPSPPTSSIRNDNRDTFDSSDLIMPSSFGTTRDSFSNEKIHSYPSDNTVIMNGSVKSNNNDYAGISNCVSKPKLPIGNFITQSTVIEEEEDNDGF